MGLHKNKEVFFLKDIDKGLQETTKCKENTYQAYI
jgi:hypothetical protein